MPALAIHSPRLQYSARAYNTQPALAMRLNSYWLDLVKGVTTLGVSTHPDPNMASCSMCNLKAVSMAALVDHIIRVHQHHPHFLVHCRYDGCGQTFKKWKSFTQHLRRRHGEQPSVNRLDTEMEEGIENATEDSDPSLQEEDISLCGTEYPGDQVAMPRTDYPTDPVDQQTWQKAEYLLQLKADAGLSQLATDKAVDATGTLVASVVRTLKEQFRHKLETTDLSSVLKDKIAGILDECHTEEMFADLSSSYQQELFYKEKFHLVVFAS